MNAGHGGKSGRDGAIEEIAIDYAFALKISEKIWLPNLEKKKLIPIYYLQVAIWGLQK